jgi:hypothetical protein
MPLNDEYLPSAGFTTPKAAAGIVIGSVIILALIRRGFRGVNLGGVSVGVK